MLLIDLEDKRKSLRGLISEQNLMAQSVTLMRISVPTPIWIGKVFQRASLRALASLILHSPLKLSPMTTLRNTSMQSVVSIPS